MYETSYTPQPEIAKNVNICNFLFTLFVSRVIYLPPSNDTVNKPFYYLYLFSHLNGLF